MHILIVEDDPISALILQKAVEKLGFACLVARDGEEAWRLFQDTEVDVVISDWMMPGIDGIELCRRVRASQREAYPYFILLTTLGTREHMLHGLQMGADDYLAKPLDRDELQVRLIAAERVTSLYQQLAAHKVELERRTQALEATTREQETFIYTVSHDLKAPLISLQGMARMLGEDYAARLDDQARLYLDRIVANADKMHAMMNDLLEFSRVGRVEVDYGAVDLGEVVRGVVEQLRHTLTARGAEVRVDGRLPTVYADHTRMTQLLTNLIDNAVKYTPAGRAPLVEVAASDRENCWEITVRDNGAGIPQAFHEKVFGLFQRLPSGKALNPGGSGVGLAIVARIVETHGGTCWIESEEGVGTAFHCTLPKRAAVETTGTATY